MSDLDFEGSLVDDIRQLAGDPAAFDRPAFDVYEDNLTGATIAVPSGFGLTWNEERLRRCPHPTTTTEADD